MSTTPILTRSEPRVTDVGGLRIVGHRKPVLFGDRIRLTVGRTRQRTIRIEHPSVSRRHCVIRRTRDGQFEIVDWESTSGVWISPRGRYSEYRPVKSAVLHLGMSIKLGKVRLLTADAKGRCPIMVTRYSELIIETIAAYGSANQAAKFIGRSRKAIARFFARLTKKDDEGEE